MSITPAGTSIPVVSAFPESTLLPLISILLPAGASLMVI
jgi:hypothetical protein